MPSLTLKQITTALRISRNRVEQWIARGYFRTPDAPVLGLPREWDIGDAIRLAVCVELVDATISPEIAGSLTQVALHGFKEGTAYFVAWQGWHPTSMRDAEGKPKKMLLPGHWHTEIVRERDLVRFLTNTDVKLSVVICLDHVERRVKRALQVE